MRSLRTELWKWMLGLLTTVEIVAAGIFYWNAKGEAQGFFDQQLRLIALNVDTRTRDRAPLPNDAPPTTQRTTLWCRSGTRQSTAADDGAWTCDPEG